MSQKNIEFQRRILEAFNRHDIALADDELEMESRLVAMEGGYPEHEGLRRSQHRPAMRFAP
jgi:hypothetical protein